MAGAGVEGWMRGVLQRREAEGTLRDLKVAETEGCSLDFGSNDYLGLARSQELAVATEREVERIRRINAAPRGTMPAEYGMLPPLMGSGGSRLLSGNSSYAEELEASLAMFHKREAALIFNSGYDANLGVLSCIPQRGDAVVYDELVHNSMQMGMKLGRQTAQIAFRHNDCAHLQQVLSGLRAAGSTERIFVALESIYSMDGDCAPLEQLLQVAEANGAWVIVDEAHATGVLGPNGEGLVGALGLENSPALFCSVHTFGKALGVHGAAVFGSATLRKFLINYARPLIYSTSLPMHSLAAIRCSYDMQRIMHAARSHVLNLVAIFRAELVAPSEDDTPPLSPSDLVESTSPIQAVLVPGNERAIKVADLLREHGFDVRPIRKPTVPEGTERLRICIHAHNSVTQVRDLIHHIRAFKAGATTCGQCTCGQYKRQPCKCHQRLEYFQQLHGTPPAKL
ncbi:pyridoxal phosphate-dependent transferase [Tribonema minus]|uniref:Pyridoxal phosphate-dependent transferase n=1 Tax=Tribonema minus TaxID=303371 RepID=A0A835YWE3_9STRA|nr:pyridoxal phosphate-dependent transferase [Tribonema minus]